MFNSFNSFIGGMVPQLKLTGQIILGLLAVYFGGIKVGAKAMSKFSDEDTKGAFKFVGLGVGIFILAIVGMVGISNLGTSVGNDANSAVPAGVMILQTVLNQ